LNKNRYQLGLKITDDEFLITLRKIVAARIKGKSIEFDEVKGVILSKFWEDHENLKKHPNLRAWCFVVCKNLVNDMLKRHDRSRTSRFSEMSPSRTDRELSQSSHLSHSVEIHEVLKFLSSDKFSDNDRMVFYLRVEQMSYEEISQILEISSDNARKINSRLRKKLFNWRNT